MDTRGKGGPFEKGLPFPLAFPLPYPKTFILKGGPEGPPLLCGIIPAGWQAAMPEQFFQAQAFWKTSSPSRTSIWTA